MVQFVSHPILYPREDIKMLSLTLKDYWSYLEQVFLNSERELAAIMELHAFKQKNDLNDYICKFN
jgi:hypothetical protein